MLRDRAVDGAGRSTPVTRWLAAIAKAQSVAGPTEALVAGPSPPGADEHAPEERQVCGGAWVKVGADGQIEGDPGDDAAEAAALREQTIAALRADRDGYARAVAVWMRGGDMAALVALAVGTSDPKVYGLAFRTCWRSPVASASCNLLNARQWARLDPGNAAPWLYLLDEASAEKDTAGVDEALFQIGNANRSAFDAFGPLLPIIDAAPSADRQLLAAMRLVIPAVGTGPASVRPAYTPLRAACSRTAIADANRRQVCTRVAGVLAERSDDLLVQSIGRRLSEDVTGASDRYELQRAEQRAWTAADPGATDAVEALGCRGLRRTLDRLRAQALHGEVGAMRQWVAQTGLGLKELLERSRAFDSALAAAGARAASAASAAEAALAASAPS